MRCDGRESAAATYSPPTNRILAEVATSGLKTWQAKQQPTHQPCTQTSFEPAFSQPNQPTSDFCLSIQPVSQSKPLPGAIKSMISNRKCGLVFSLNLSLFRFVERARPVAKHRLVPVRVNLINHP